MGGTGIAFAGLVHAFAVPAGWHGACLRAWPACIEHAVANGIAIARYINHFRDVLHTRGHVAEMDIDRNRLSRGRGLTWYDTPGWKHSDHSEHLLAGCQPGIVVDVCELGDMRWHVTATWYDEPVHLGRVHRVLEDREGATNVLRKLIWPDACQSEDRLSVGRGEPRELLENPEGSTCPECGVRLAAVHIACKFTR